jgi:hypothetical protein
MAVDFVDICIVGIPALLFYVLKTYTHARAVWEQFRSAASLVSPANPAHQTPFFRFRWLERFPDDVRLLANSRSSENSQAR